MSVFFLKCHSKYKWHLKLIVMTRMCNLFYRKKNFDYKTKVECHIRIIDTCNKFNHLSKCSFAFCNTFHNIIISWNIVFHNTCINLTLKGVFLNHLGRAIPELNVSRKGGWHWMTYFPTRLQYILTLFVL